MPQKHKYRWYPNVRRYRARNGRFISQDTVTGYVHDTTMNFKASILTRTNKLIEDFSAEKFIDWATVLRREIINLHNSVTIVALGGRQASIEFSQKNTEIWRAAETAMSEQLRFFDRFLLQATAGALNFDGSFATRAAMYAEAGYGTFQNAMRLREYEAGQNQERRTLGFVLTTHCDDCVVEADLDWGPVGSRRSIGDSQCGSRCKCNFEFRYVDE